jgi:hypothetical protein
MAKLTCPGGANVTGAFKLSWEGGDGASFRVSEGAKLLYEGKDLATTVTGRHAGTYAYELVEVEGGARSACEVTVDPPSLGAAFGAFGVGSVVFVATLWLVLAGHRAHRAGEIG